MPYDITALIYYCATDALSLISSQAVSWMRYVAPLNVPPGGVLLNRKQIEISKSLTNIICVSLKVKNFLKV